MSSEKWQIGAAGIAIAPRKWGLFGSLVTVQQSFAGDSDREDVGLVTIQPLLLYNLPEGVYLRSTAIWNFDYHNENHYVPLGFGAGKVVELTNTVTLNAFVEPQYTVFENYDTAPQWQVFVGVNLQFALR